LRVGPPQHGADRIEPSAGFIDEYDSKLQFSSPGTVPGTP